MLGVNVFDVTKVGRIVYQHRDYNSKPIHIAGNLLADVKELLSRKGIRPWWLFAEKPEVISIGPYRKNVKLCGCCENLTCNRCLENKVLERMDGAAKRSIRSQVQQIQKVFDTNMTFMVDRKAKELFRKWQQAEIDEKMKNLKKKEDKKKKKDSKKRLYNPDDLV